MDIQTLDIQTLQEKIGYPFQNEELLLQALTHSSYANEHRKGGDNERLEFLGDAVLELASSDFLYHRYPSMPEGKMTRLRARLVCETSLAECARRIGLPSLLRLGHGEDKGGGRERDSVVSDAMEALIGAVYLDGGFAQAARIVNTFVLYDIESRRLFVDSKTILQEMLQQHMAGSQIVYELLSQEGPAHARVFRVQVKAGGKVLGTGEGGSKKAAQQQAAYEAVRHLKENEKKPD